MEALQREIELLKELVKAKDDLIAELRLKSQPSLISQWTLKDTQVFDAKPWNPGDALGTVFDYGSTANPNKG